MLNCFRLRNGSKLVRNNVKCYVLNNKNAVSFWGLRPQAPNDSTIRANQKLKETNERWAKYWVLSISSRQLLRTSSLRALSHCTWN